MIKNSFRILILSIILLSCTTVEKVKTGHQALERKQYAVAIELFQKEFKSAKPNDKAEIAFLLGESYRNLKQTENAVKWYLNSAESGNKSDQLYYYTALMYKQTGQYQQAMNHFDRVSIKNNQLQLQAKRERDICRQAIQWQASNIQLYQIQPFGKEIDFHGYLSGFDPKGNFLISAEQDIKGISGKKHKWTGRPFLNIFYAGDGELSQLKNFGNHLNTAYHEADLTINQSNNELVFTRCSPDGSDENFCQLYTSVQVDQNWTEPVRMPFQSEKINYGHGFFANDSLLFFSSNDPKGKGGYDIYYMRKTKNRWMAPVGLPEPVNTPGNEFYPSVVGDTIYFSSDHLPGLGGMDIFRTFPLSDGRWSPPQNLLPPINSPADDFGFHSYNESDKQPFAYINSNRDSRTGTDRIFAVSKIETIAKDTMSIETEKPVESKNYRLFLTLRVFEQVFEDVTDPNSQILGKKPVNKAEGRIIEAEKTFSTDLNGRYITELKFDTNYSVIIDKSSYLTYYLELPAVPYPAENTKLENHNISREVIIQKIYLDKEMVMENIFYDLDKWDIRMDAVPALNSLLSTMIKNPELKVLIGAHTDCRADDAYNLELSKKRAESVVDFLTKGGILQERITYEGYGETRLIEKCACEQCNEAQHQKNRRTTFTLSK